MNQKQTPHSGLSPSIQDTNDYVPYVPPPSEGPKKEVVQLGFADPFIWLRKGWQDLLSFKTCTSFFGICFVLMAIVLGVVFKNKPEYAMSIVSGCLLLGPFLALGLYEVSRRNELGLPKSFVASTTSWRNHIRSMGMLVLVLIVLELLWGRASLVVFAVFFNTGMPSTTGVMEAIFNPQNLEFLLVYAMVGGIFAALVFSVSVVSIPMILDRDTDAISAAITSLQVVFKNLPIMILWGALLTVLVALALLPWGLGLVLIGPWLGYATWHAYRGSVKWLDKV
ncbi:MAG TPA: DUF2189 domain-containing protein [Burkholderiaceae bacterium]|nr:DUF2189 domain-containing protein [Burkholderiaceae bacterium]